MVITLERHKLDTLVFVVCSRYITVDKGKAIVTKCSKRSCRDNGDDTFRALGVLAISFDTCLWKGTSSSSLRSEGGASV